MANHNDPRPDSGPDASGAARLAFTLASEEDLLRAISAVRGIGPSAREALDALMGLKAVRQLRATWAAWDAFCHGYGVDADTLVEGAVPPELLALARETLRGDPPTWYLSGADDLEEIVLLYTNDADDAAEMVAAASRLGFGVSLRSEAVAKPGKDYVTIRWAISIRHDSPQVEE